jgi:hypothetical protein
MDEELPKVRVGCCGFPVGRKDYFSQFKLAEVQQSFYKMPRLGIGEKEMELPNIESVLVRLNLEFCKPRRCSSCPIREECQKAGAA